MMKSLRCKEDVQICVDSVAICVLARGNWRYRDVTTHCDVVHCVARGLDQTSSSSCIVRIC
jgi:hypothetical protein